ncbi:uncharacterized protein LOC141700652 [Apium graveolens]|uniref:uncharacterized protein LOC141700652 n=1 Tax=Apium graveolens TaxID=4045 RepID=UPI003D7A6267
MMMMMTLTQNPLDHRFLELCCCSVATGLAIASSFSRATTTRCPKHIEYSPSKFNSCCIRNHPLKIRPLRLQAHQVNRGGTISQLSKTSSLEICAAAFNSACFKTETKPLMSRQQQTAPTIRSPFGGTSKSPVLDDGGGIGGGGEGGWKFEFYRGGDGQGPGGGGGDWSGEFYFILFILFLVLLRDRKKEKRMQEEEEEDRRM